MAADRVVLAPSADCGKRSMPGLLIIAHAPLASALNAVAAHAYPECAGRLAVLDVPPDWTIDETERALRLVLDPVRDPQALILVDVFGATPCNAARRVADGADVRLVCGVSVPMLWRVLCYAHDPLDVLVGRAMSGAIQGVLQATPQPPQNQALHSGSNDQSHARHHQ